MKMIKKILRGILIFTICFTTMSISYQSMPVYAADESDYEKLFDSNYQPYEKTDKYIWIQIHTYNQDKSVNVRRVALYMKRGDKIPVDKLNLPKESELVKPSDDSTFEGWYVKRIDRSNGFDTFFDGEENLAYSDNFGLSQPGGDQLIDDRDKEYKLNDFTLDYYMSRELYFKGSQSDKEFIIFPKFSKCVYHPYRSVDDIDGDLMGVYTSRILLPDDKYKEQINKNFEGLLEKYGYTFPDVYYDSDSRLPGISEGVAYSDEELIDSAKSLYDGKRGELTWHVYRYGLLYTYLYPTADNVTISYKYTYIDKKFETEE